MAVFDKGGENFDLSAYGDFVWRYSIKAARISLAKDLPVSDDWTCCLLSYDASRKELTMSIRMNWTRLMASFGLLSLCATGAAQNTEDDRIQEVVRAAELASAACDADIRKFCDDVTPGEGRMLACLQAYRDRVHESCDEALAQWQGPDLLKDFQTTRLYPTLEDRELGEPNVDEDGDRVIWPYRLPFLGALTCPTPMASASSV
jgi:hypothetical protein